jgi:hypothetical protein
VLDPTLRRPPDGYLAFDKNIQASDTRAINEQQKMRNVYFHKWMIVLANITEALGHPMVYSAIGGLGPEEGEFYQQPVMFIVQFPTLAPTWTGAVTLYHVDMSQELGPELVAHILIGIAQGG